jgi:putative FmdB family regulatory protein
MPMYDYRCPQCQTTFEQLVSFSKADEVPCPRCGYRYGQRRVSKIALRTNAGSGNAGSDSSSSCIGGISSGGG